MLNITEFHKSIWLELSVICERVRFLVRHAPEDWRYKEAILMNVIKKFLPKTVSIWTWFVVSWWLSREDPHNASNQIDIIIYDNSFPVLFAEGDFIIVTPDSVRAIIEVKSDVKNAWIWTTIQKSNENGLFIANNCKGPVLWIYNWIFSYKGEFIDYGSLKSTIREKTNSVYDDMKCKYLINHISFNEHLFLKYWNENHTRRNKFALYQLQELSFSFFISNLLDYLTKHYIGQQNLMYAIDKEEWKIWDDF